MHAERQTASEDDMALDLGGLLRAIGRALVWLLPLTLFVAVAVFLGLQFVAPKYQAEARILIESTDNRFPGASRGAEEERAILDSEGVASQVQLLMSTDLARRVAQELDLAAIPEFEAKGSSSLVGDLLTSIGLGKPSAGNSEEERVLSHFYENLQIYRLEGSRVIAVDYTAENPVLSAKVANAIVDEYLAVQRSAKRQTTELASAALEPRIAELRKEVQAARQAVADFRARADLLIGADNIPLHQQQLAETSSNHSAAQAAKAESQAKADLIRELLDSGGSLETASDVLNSLLIQRLRERQVELQSNIAELSITLLPNHPQLKALRSQLDDYDRQIVSEARKILQGLENDAKVANQQAMALEERLNELKAAAARSNADQARLSELEREADAKAEQLDQLMRSYQEADSRLQAQVLPADARIISRAGVPVEPVSPKIISSTIIAALVTVILGSAFVLMREFLSGNALYRTHHSAPGNARAAPLAAADFAPAGSFGWERGYSQTVSNYRMDAEFAGRPASLPEPLKPAMPEAGQPEAEMPESEMPEHGQPEPGLQPEPHRLHSDESQEQQSIAEEISEPAAGTSNRISTLRAAIARRMQRKERNKTDQDAQQKWVGDLRKTPIDDEPIPVLPEPGTPAVDPVPTTSVEDVEAAGRIVVLSVDDDTLSHNLAFDLVRKAAKAGKTALIMEVFPEQNNKKAAEGFADIVAGTAPFAKVVYRDAASKAHIIEAGRVEITDDMVGSERFKLALEAIRSTYQTIVIDLGAIDGTLASARMLSFADKVLIAASAPDHGHELESAANLLAHNTGAKVEVVISGGAGPDPRRNDDGHAA